VPAFRKARLFILHGTAFCSRMAGNRWEIHGTSPVRAKPQDHR
jgi:hypothetical protein